METIAERIKKIRKCNNLNQTEFGEKIGVTRSVINNIELDRNKNGIPDNIIKLIAFTFNVNEEWLRTGNGEMFNQDESFSLDKFLQEQEATELEIDLIKIYMRLDKSIRKKMMSDFKKAVEKNNSTTVTSKYDNMSTTELLTTIDEMQEVLEKKQELSLSQEPNNAIKDA